MFFNNSPKIHNEVLISSRTDPKVQVHDRKRNGKNNLMDWFIFPLPRR